MAGDTHELATLALDDLCDRFDSGDNVAALQALRACGQYGVAMPDWLVDALFRATNQWFSLRVRTLDEAFGVELPKGKHLDRLRERQKLRVEVFNRIEALRNEGCSVSEALFDIVGREFGIRKTKCGELYYECRKNSDFCGTDTE